MLRLVLLISFYLCTCAARAQTAEETVAFIIAGFEVGKLSISPCGEVEPSLITNSPLRYRFKCKDGQAYDYVIRTAGRCRYQVGWANEVGGELKEEDRATIDFNLFSTLL
ncbi:unnamed protein product, partial [Phaeothamnion confervicola]